jgi:hypothetical protein
MEDDEGHKGLTPILSWPDGFPQWPRTSDEIDPLIPAVGVGGGFLMLARDALAEFAPVYGEPLPYFAEEVRLGAHLGEDLCFCLRAADLGLQTWVHRGVQVGHRKAMRLGGAVS